GELQRAGGAAERIAELLRARSEIRPPAHPRKLAARVSGWIELQAVRSAYPTRPEPVSYTHLRAHETRE
ncbi:ABC transporter ATP-binding protein, partial [Pseudomonas aeruginosa]